MYARIIIMEFLTTCRSSPPVNFILREDGTAYVCQDFRIIGTNDPAFDFEGNLRGPFNLTLASGRHLDIRDTATNAVLRDGEYSTSPAGACDVKYERFGFAVFFLCTHTQQLDHLVYS